MVNTLLNFNTKCRSCLAEDQEMHHLFREFDQGLTLSDILRSTTYFEIEDNDGSSPYLCESCTTIVVEFFNFKTIYVENYNYIKSLYKEKTISEDEDSNEIAYIKREFDFESNTSTRSEKLEATEVVNSPEIQVKQLETIEESIKPYNIIEQDATGNNGVNEKKEFLNSVKYSCRECGDCFLLKSGFRQHMLKKHDISACDFEEFISEETIEVPKAGKLEIANENIVLQCDTCNDNFKSYAEIEEHCKSHIKYVCEHCGAGFQKKSYLNDHSEIHSTEKRHVCPMCGKAFRRRTVLVKHKRIHTHPRQCVCEICGLRFTDKGTLKTHIKLKHTKERNFNCLICGLWFPLKSTLMKHVYRHNEDRKREHICDVCHMAYKDKSSLNRHVSTKHSENNVKPSCSFCGKEYTSNTNLLKHIRRHHKPVQLKNVSDVKQEDIDTS